MHAAPMAYGRGLHNSQYYFGGFLIIIIVYWAPNPILCVKAPILHVGGICISGFPESYPACEDVASDSASATVDEPEDAIYPEC